MVYVEEIHGGTSGTEYVYFILSNELVHVSQLPSARIARGPERMGGRRRRMIWYVPDNVVAGRRGIVVSFSRKGRYPYVHYFKLPQDVSNITISFGELYKRGLVDESVKDPIKEIILKYDIRVKLFGSERNQLNLYRQIIPKLVNDIWSELKVIGVKDIFVSEHAERLGETLKDPAYAEIMSLILPTPQGRVRSLHEKITRTYEIWLLTKVARALHELGARSQSDILWISFTTNEPALKMSYKDKVIYIMYQPSIVPHIISGFVPQLPKPFHAVPDIAVMILDEEKYIEWGDLRKYVDNVPLLVEAKLSLAGETRYESVETVMRQVEAYRLLMNKKPKVIVPICYRNASAVYRLRTIEGVIAIDEVNPDNPTKVHIFFNYVKKVIEEVLL